MISECIGFSSVQSLSIVLSTILIGLISIECFLYQNQIFSIFFSGINQRISSNTARCTDGTFRLDNMTTCHPILGCMDLKRDLQFTDQVLGEGAQKIVWKGMWQNHEVAVNTLRHKMYLNDFLHGLDMLKLFNKDPGYKENKIVQLIGWCLDDPPVIVTEMHHLGAASHIHEVLRNRFPDVDPLIQRFRMCLEFVHVLNILHSHADGPRVMCDANYPEKALSQFLLSNNLSLILNDVDALPQVNRKSGKFVKCGHRELQGDYLAPEQSPQQFLESDAGSVLTYSKTSSPKKHLDEASYCCLISGSQGLNWNNIEEESSSCTFVEGAGSTYPADPVGLKREMNVPVVACWSQTDGKN
ncbi:protein o-mannose kinase [Plakobranchus ocellatus]|uniref:Protein o-mannose kinase n=1 Tax=Plakobranchus ocellatus TaxID=259542 RepID=A0AAV4DWM0_9GAST|nr:protein o-mannose kinase [Plakobranchus ocellatus]